MQPGDGVLVWIRWRRRRGSGSMSWGRGA